MFLVVFADLEMGMIVGVRKVPLRSTGQSLPRVEVVLRPGASLGFLVGFG
jgi:hypothetical protein